VIGRAIRRYAYGATIVTLTTGIVVVAAFLLLVAGPDLSSRTAGPVPTAAPVFTPEPTPGSAMALSPVGIQMPTDAKCDACHLTTNGTVGTKPIPKLGHPLWGFRNCTACHSPGGLVQTAPGHSSLHKDDCLVCHQVADSAKPGTSVAPLRPEHMGGDKACTACHGVDKHAPLPEDMKGRNNCWVCHNGAEFKYLFESPSPGTSPGTSPGASPDASAGASPEASAGSSPSGAPDASPAADAEGTSDGSTWWLLRH
jgi:hypothetical protein